MAIEKEEHEGYIYFIRERRKDDRGRIKIGWASADPNSRFSGVNTGAPRDLDKFALMRAPFSHEGALHARFSRYWKKGEWFRSGERLLAYIKEHARNWDELLEEERVAAVAERETRKTDEEREEERRQVFNEHYLKCLRLGYNREEILKIPVGETPPDRIQRTPVKRPRRYGPLQAMLDKLAADKDTVP